ncbi:hypothetical protein BGZ83_000717 [Gryganskiella cystojenkinii]|nr:hypothetical protein BGZ83_000717 [Gryganskiella cystojenkinii]
MAPDPCIVIVGAGIAGLTLAIMLERAGMHRYIILERSPTLRPLGSHMALSAMMLRCFEQLGLIEEIIEVAKPSVGNVFFDEEMNYIGNLTSIFIGERFGYYNMILTRPDLYAILARHVPAHKMIFGKKVLALTQTSDGATIRCADKSIYYADIVIGADGTYSGVRQAIYATLDKNAPVRANRDAVQEQVQHLKKSEGGEGKTLANGLKRILNPLRSLKTSSFSSSSSSSFTPRNNGLPATTSDVRSINSQDGGGVKVGGVNSGTVILPKSDITAMRFDHPAIVGVTEPLDPVQYPFLTGKCTQGITILMKNGVSLWIFAVYNNRLSYGVGGRALIPGNKSGGVVDTFKTSAWDTRDVEEVISQDWLRNLKIPFGGVFGDLLDKTPKDTIARIAMEDKFFRTWYYKRTVLVGDAAHKNIIYAGVGAVNAVMDCIVLMNCLYDMPDGNTFTQDDITRAFQLYYSIRAKPAAAAVKGARQVADFICNTSSFSYRIRKGTIRSMPEIFLRLSADRVFVSRPILSFLPFVPDFGTRKSVPQLLGRRDREELELLRTRERAAREEETRRKAAFKMFSRMRRGSSTSINSTSQTWFADREVSSPTPLLTPGTSDAVPYGPLPINDFTSHGKHLGSAINTQQLQLQQRQVLHDDVTTTTVTPFSSTSVNRGSQEAAKSGVGRILRATTMGGSATWPTFGQSSSPLGPPLQKKRKCTDNILNIDTGAVPDVIANASATTSSLVSVESLLREGLPLHNYWDEHMAIHLYTRGIRAPTSSSSTSSSSSSDNSTSMSSYIVTSPSSSAFPLPYTIPRYPYANPDGREVQVENAAKSPLSGEASSLSTSSTSMTVASTFSFSSRYTLPYDDQELAEYAKMYSGPTFQKNVGMLQAPFAASMASSSGYLSSPPTSVDASTVFKSKPPTTVPCTCDAEAFSQGSISSTCECCSNIRFSSKVSSLHNNSTSTASVMRVFRDKYLPSLRRDAGTSNPPLTVPNHTSEQSNSVPMSEFLISFPLGESSGSADGQGRDCGRGQSQDCARPDSVFTEVGIDPGHFAASSQPQPGSLPSLTVELRRDPDILENHQLLMNSHEHLKVNYKRPPDTSMTKFDAVVLGGFEEDKEEGKREVEEEEEVGLWTLPIKTRRQQLAIN